MLEEKHALANDRANESLELGQKILFFIFCWGIIPWVMAGTFKAKGYKQKYKDAWKMMKIGMLVFFGIPIGLFVILSILS